MSEITNEAVIKVTADASGVEAGLRRVDDAAAKTGKNLDNLEASAKKTTSALEGAARTPGLEAAGDGAGIAAGRMDRATKSMADSIQRTMAQMNAGAKGSAQYYEALANARGLDVNALRPFLNQLDDMTRKSALAADAQRKLDESTKFLDSLRSRTEGIGKSASELAALRAQQLGVSDAAAEMIEKLREQEQAGESSFGGLGDMAGRAKIALLAVAASVAAAAAAGVAMINGALDGLAELDDLAQKTGSSVESLSKIQNLAAVFGADMGAIDGALSKVSKGMTAFDDDSSKVQKALKALGVSSKDAAGNLRDPSEVLVDAAKSLQGYSDGASKAALLTDLLGKSGPDLLPFLNDLAEHYDKVKGTSAESAGAAAGFQDQIGWLKLELKDFIKEITVNALPALSDLTGAFADVYEQQTNLKNGEWKEWADNLGLGIAKAADIATALARGVSVIWNSIKAVRADMEFLRAGMANANPLVAGYKWITGGSPNDDLKAALDRRNKNVEEANKKLAEIWSRPYGQYEEAYLKRLNDRGVNSAVPPSPEKPKPRLQYVSGTDSDAKDAKKELEQYEALVDRINGKTVGLDPDFYGNLAKLYKGYQDGKQSLQEYVDTVEAYIGQQSFVKQAEEERLKSLEKYQKAYDVANAASTKAATDLQTQRDENEQIGEGKKALGELNATRLESLALRAEEKIWMAEGLDITGALAEEYRKEAAALRERAAAVREGAAKQVNADAVKKAGEDLDKFLDPTKAQTFGEALKGAFGAAGDSMTQLVTSLDAYGIRQAEIDKARKDASVKYATDAKGYADASAAITAKEVKSRLSGYGDMAAAAKGFFSEGSKGYGVLSGVEKAYRAAELAMAVQAMTKKIFFKQAEVTANTALNATKITGEAAATAASTGLAATEASAWGVTAVVKAIASLPFPLNLAAGAATLAAVVAVGAKMFGGVGGGGMSLTGERQKAQGTGSVLGSDAKSESIARALEAIEGTTLQGLGISNGMLTSLRNIEAGIGQFASLLVRTTGVTGDFGSDMSKNVFDSKAIGIGGAAGGAVLGAMGGAYVGMGTSQIGLMLGGPVGMALGAALGAVIGKTFIGKALGSVFGGKQTVEDTGFTVSKTDFASIFGGGLNAMQYADIKKDGGWFRSDKYSTKTEGLGEEGNRQISSVLMSLYDTVFEAGQMIGIGADGFAAQLNGFVVDIGKVSLKGLSDDEIQKELEAVFSKVGDDLAKFGVSGLEQFQKVGEGYLETLARVATNYQAVTVVTDSLGMTFGSLGVASIGARERLIDLVGGLDEFTSGAEQFLADFYNDQERANSLRARITPTLDQFGIKTGAEDSLQQFRSVVTGLDLTTEAGARAYATLIQIAPAFKQIADVDTKIFEERADLQKELDQLTLTETQLLAQQRAALDESNRSLFDQIQAIKAQKTAAEQAAEAIQKAKDSASSLLGGVDGAFSVLQKVVGRQKEALQDDIQARTEAVNKLKSLTEAARNSLNGMRTPEQQQASQAQARADIGAALAIARAGGGLGDTEALQRAISALGNGPSMDAYATYQDYQRDLFGTQGDLAELAKLTDGALTIEERALKAAQDQAKQLDEMLKREQEQIDVLKGLSTIGLSIEQAIKALQGAMAAARQNPVVSASAAINNAYQQHLGRAPDAAGFEWYQNAAAGGAPISQLVDSIANSAEADLKKLYQSALGRAPDAEGLAYWMKAFGPTMDAAEKAEFLKGAKPEFDAIAAGKQDEFLKLRGFAVGTNQVPYDMPALIHKDERIIPAADNRELMRRLANPAGNADALAAEVARLSAVMEAQQRENVELREALRDGLLAIATHTSNTASHLDDVVNGRKPVVTEAAATTPVAAGVAATT